MELDQKLHNLYLELCEKAYKEGRQHQREAQWLGFKDTKTYKAIMENKPDG